MRCFIQCGIINTERIKISLGFRSPEEYRQSLGLNIKNTEEEEVTYSYEDKKKAIDLFFQQNESYCTKNIRLSIDDEPAFGVT